MKQFSTLFLLFFLFVGQAFSQSHINYDRDSRWFIGVNMGGTWTTRTEVKSNLGLGYGFTFGKSFGMEPDKAIAWDWRFRFLHAQFHGQATERYMLNDSSVNGLHMYDNAIIKNYKDSVGYFIPNYHTNLIRGSFELVMNTNRLRQNTGWNIMIFGGIGITGYHTKTDLVDNGGIYDYDQIDKLSKSNIKSVQDADFETDVVGEAGHFNGDIMPSFGFGLSYQVHPAVALGIEHKITWPQTNLFDGMPNGNSGVNSEENDVYHYTALTAKFHLFRSRYYQEHEEEIEDEVVIKENPVDHIQVQKPVVDIYDPNNSPYTAETNSFLLKAKVYYVDGKRNITFKQDGNVNSNFNYNPSTDEFESRVVLHAGQNLFEITAQNEAGADYETVVIIYDEKKIITPPIVTITNPSGSSTQTSSSPFNFSAQVLNVNTKSDIQMYLNGVNLTGFSYNLSNKVLNATLHLNEGTNTVIVTGTNRYGSDSKTTKIIYKKPVSIQPPIVTFIQPTVDPFYSDVASTSIKASVLNVEGKSDITVWLNGNNYSSFSFNNITKELIFTARLIEGANQVKIQGRNAAGTDIESTTIIYNKPQTIQPPVVTILDPSSSPTNVFTPTYNLAAKVEYVKDKSKIRLTINGVASTSFNYSNSSKLMNFTTSLLEGSNVIEIKGVNAYGNDTKTTTIVYKRQLTKVPPIVNITYPGSDNQIFTTANINLSASVLNVTNKSSINIVVNGNTTYDFTYNSGTKVVDLPLVLREGDNSITITGTNANGTASKTRIIKYEKPIVARPPLVSIIHPSSSPFMVVVPDFTFTANTTNIESKSQIQFKVNGIHVSDEFYSFTAGRQIVYTTRLSNGNNIFEVTVTNEFGSDNAVAIVNYTKDEAPCIIPTVGYISPVPYSTVEVALVNIDAQINNHSDDTEISIKLNDVNKGSMTYNPGTSIASKSITLNEGSNAITVIVTNACGSNQAAFTLNYIKESDPCTSPLLSTAEETSITTLAETISLMLNGTAIGDSRELSVKLNGRSIPLIFDEGSGNIQVNAIPLIIGTNTVAISVVNDCGADNIVYTIVREECKLPNNSALSHLDGAVVENGEIVFEATVLNVSEEDITIVHNGIAQAINYNGITKKVSAALSLTEGVNTIQLKSTNDCGEDVETVKITRKVPCTKITTNYLVPNTPVVTSTTKLYTVLFNATGITSKDQIVATFNDVKIDVDFDLVSNNITAKNLKLKEGVNILIFQLKNDCSERKVTYTINYNGCKAPIIKFNGLTPGMEVGESGFNLAALVSNITDAEDLKFYFNGVLTDFDFNPVSHLLTAVVALNEGKNTFKISARGCENVNEEISINYKLPCEITAYSLMIPATTTAVSIEDNYSISLTATGVERKEQVTVKKGLADLAFTFTAETGAIRINDISLSDGENNIQVSLKNDCSENTVNYSITYNGCESPDISINTVMSEVYESEFLFNANISHIDEAGQITLTLNGDRIDFVYDSEMGVLDATLMLNAGENIVNIEADGCETANETMRVNYVVPCEPIMYSLITPAELIVEVREDTYDIALFLENATSRGIEVQLDGADLPYVYADNILNINTINLVDGVNMIRVNLSNACSDETLTFEVNHAGCSTPIIDASSNLISVESAGYSLMATIENMERDDAVEVKLNGTTIPSEFSALSNLLTASFDVRAGSNTIDIIANGCVRITERLSVEYIAPCFPITFEYITPATSVELIDGDRFEMSLSTENVDPALVSVSVNGTEVPHTLSAGIVSFTAVDLFDGPNNVEVNLSNACSSELIVYTLDRAGCTTPEIILGDFRDGLILTEPEYAFEANVMHVDDAGIIELLLNGVAVPFEFDSGSGQITADLRLIVGLNDVTITVDGCELVMNIVNVTLDEPCVKPAYSLIIPGALLERTDASPYLINLNATHVGADEITVLHNGSSHVFDLTDEILTIELDLVDGANTVLVTMANHCGTETVEYVINYSSPDACVPTITVDFEEDFSAVSVRSDKELINVMLNLSEGGNELVEGLSGYTTTLSPSGENVGKCITGVWVRSGCNTSAAGEPFGDYINDDRWTGICDLAEPCEPLTYRLISPTSRSAVAATSPYTIVISVENMDGGSVSVLVNGIAKPARIEGGMLTINTINLRAGSNTIRVDLTNDCGSETIIYTVSYTTPVIIKDDGAKDDDKVDGAIKNKVESGKIDGDKTDGSTDLKLKKEDLEKEKTSFTKPDPVILPIMPKTTLSNVASKNYSFKAKIENLTSAKDVSLYLNGIRLNDFNYNLSTRTLYAKFVLKNGVNLVKVVATSNGKKVEKVFTIKLNAQLENKVDTPTKLDLKPVFTKVNPRSTFATSKTAQYKLTTKVKNVKSKTDIVATINGNRIYNYTYNTGSTELIVNANLKSGANKIVITATNGNQKTTSTYTITYKAEQNKVDVKPTDVSSKVVQTPSFKLDYPASTTFKVESASIALKNKIANVKSKADIVLTVNGVKVTSFTYNAASDQFYSNIKLRSGKNTIKITAKNGDKAKSLTYYITYTAKVLQAEPIDKDGGKSKSKLTQPKDKDEKKPTLTSPTKGK